METLIKRGMGWLTYGHALEDAVQGERENDQDVPDGGEDALLLGQRLLHGGLAAVGAGERRLPLRAAHLALGKAGAAVVGGLRRGGRVARVAVVVVMVVRRPLVVVVAGRMLAAKKY